MSRVFISHASANNAAALALAGWLDANRWSDYWLCRNKEIEGGPYATCSVSTLIKRYR